jgi:hypothetical protein
MRIRFDRGRAFCGRGDRVVEAGFGVCEVRFGGWAVI